MKAISLYEPWATLIAIGEKRYETRSWSTPYRGSLLICASKRRLPIVQSPPLAMVCGALYRAGIPLDELNWGRAVAKVDLIAVLKTNDLSFGQVGENEEYFGDFSPNRYAWHLTNVRRFVNPPYIRGRQGLFDVPDDLIKNLEMHESC